MSNDTLTIERVELRSGLVLVVEATPPGALRYWLEITGEDQSRRARIVDIGPQDVVALAAITNARGMRWQSDM